MPFIDKSACFAIFSGFTFMSQMRNKMSHHGLDAEGGWWQIASRWMGDGEHWDCRLVWQDKL